jgi:hypothetical protein
MEYTGDYPARWNQQGTWKPISGAWQLLEDRIGIRVTADHPNAWKVGTDPDSGKPVILRLVESLVGASGLSPVYLRLTCCLEADQVVTGQTTRRAECPLPYDITRHVDASDRYQKNVIDTSSEFNTTPEPVTQRDDTPAANAEATVSQVASDMGVLQGPVVIPYLTDYYKIGDRISSVVGRGLGLRTDGGLSTGLKIYPVVEGFRWDLDGKQTTTLFLSDEAQQRHLIERKLAR